MGRIELLLHPIRMRVILALASRTLSTQQLVELLSDVPQSTLYRHINLLLDGGILRIVRETKVRGAVERELALVEGAGRIDMEASATMSPEQHEQLFSTFLATVLADFRQSQERPRPGTPPAVYTRQRLYLTKEELLAINRQIDAVLAPFKDESRQTTDSDIQPWLFTGIIVPDTQFDQTDEEEQP